MALSLFCVVAWAWFFLRLLTARPVCSLATQFVFFLAGALAGAALLVPLHLAINPYLMLKDPLVVWIAYSLGIAVYLAPLCWVLLWKNTHRLMPLSEVYSLVFLTVMGHETLALMAGQVGGLLEAVNVVNLVPPWQYWTVTHPEGVPSLGYRAAPLMLLIVLILRMGLGRLAGVLIAGVAILMAWEWKTHLAAPVPSMGTAGIPTDPAARRTLDWVFMHPWVSLGLLVLLGEAEEIWLRKRLGRPLVQSLPIWRNLKPLFALWREKRPGEIREVLTRRRLQNQREFFLAQQAAHPSEPVWRRLADRLDTGLARPETSVSRPIGLVEGRAWTEVLRKAGPWLAVLVLLLGFFFLTTLSWLLAAGVILVLMNVPGVVRRDLNPIQLIEAYGSVVVRWLCLAAIAVFAASAVGIELYPFNQGPRGFWPLLVVDLSSVNNFAEIRASFQLTVLAFGGALWVASRRFLFSQDPAETSSTAALDRGSRWLALLFVVFAIGLFYSTALVLSHRYFGAEIYDFATGTGGGSRLPEWIARFRFNRPPPFGNALAAWIVGIVTAVFGLWLLRYRERLTAGIRRFLAARYSETDSAHGSRPNP